MPAQLRSCMPGHSASGERWKTRSIIKKHLRQDFHGRCAYCDDADSLVDVDFHIDHFAPKTKFPKRKFVYQNLFYACPYCNESKSEYWVCDDPDVNVINDEGIVNPCSKEYDRHLGRREDGGILPKTALGYFMYKKLRLYLLRHEVFFQIERLRKKIEEAQLTGANAVAMALYKEIDNYYRLAPTVKWKEGKVLECPDVKSGLSKRVLSKMVAHKRTVHVSPR